MPDYSHLGSAAARYEASKSPERKAAEARLRASKKAKDAEFEARQSKSAHVAAVKPSKPAASTSTQKAAAPKPKIGASDDFRRGVDASRTLERLRVSEVAKVAAARGQAAEALKMLAESDLSSDAIIAKLYGKGASGALGLSAEVWDRAIAKVAAQRNSGDAA